MRLFRRPILLTFFLFALLPDLAPAQRTPGNQTASASRRATRATRAPAASRPMPPPRPAPPPPSRIRLRMVQRPTRWDRFHVMVLNDEPTTVSGSLYLLVNSRSGPFGMFSQSQNRITPDFQLGPGEAKSFTLDPRRVPASYTDGRTMADEGGTVGFLPQSLGNSPNQFDLYQGRRMMAYFMSSFFISRSCAVGAIYSPFAKRGFLGNQDLLSFAGVAPWGGPQPPRSFFVTSPDSCPFPRRIEELAWLNAIYLDGAAPRTWNKEQKQALEGWVAQGGVLLLDPVALDALAGSPILCGVGVDPISWRADDLGAIKASLRAEDEKLEAEKRQQATANSGMRGRQGPQPPPTAAAPASGPQGRKKRLLRPIPVQTVKLTFPAEGNWAAGESAPPQFDSLGDEPVLASWRYGLGRVAVQAFEGPGDQTVSALWLKRQLTSAGNTWDAGQFRYYNPTQYQSLWRDDRPAAQSRATGIAKLQEFAAEQFRNNASFRRVALAAAASVIAGLLAFFVLRRFRERAWTLSLGVLAAAMGIVGVGLYLAGQRGAMTAQIAEIVIPFPDSPWRARSVLATFGADGMCRASATLEGAYPFALALTQGALAQATPGESAAPSTAPALEKPLPLFDPEAKQEPIAFMAPGTVLRSGDTRMGVLKIVETDDRGRVVANLSCAGASLTGEIRNDTPYTLQDGFFYQRTKPAGYRAVRLPSVFPPGAVLKIKPIAGPQPASVRALPAQRPGGRARPGVSPSGSGVARVGSPVTLSPGESFVAKPVGMNRGPDPYIYIHGHTLYNLYCGGASADEQAPVAPRAVILAYIEGEPETLGDLKISPRLSSLTSRRIYAQTFYPRIAQTGADSSPAQSAPSTDSSSAEDRE